MVQAATSSYSVNKPHIAAWVVYINGIEVPPHSVNVDFGVWAIPTAQIRLVPHVLLQRLGHEDRLQVEIYYLDAFFEPDKPRLCLLGEFEVVGWSYQTTAAGRFVQLDCRSPLKIFEQLSFYYMSSLSDIASASAGVVGTTGETYVGTSVKFPLSLFREGLVPTGTDKLITSPFEFVKNVLKALTHPIDLESEKDTDSKDGNVPRAMTGVAGRNFFGRWMQMTDFRRKWAALPFFDDAAAKSADGCFPLLNAINSNEILNVVAQQIGESVGSQGTAWELFQRVLGAMYMEILAVPAPPAAQFTTETNIPEGYFARRGADKDKTYGGLVSYMVKPQCIFGIPPACNVIFPSMIKSYSVNENYERQPTRIYLGEAYMSGIVAGQASGDTAQMSRELLVTGYPGVVKQRMQDYINNRQVNTRNFLIYPEELYKGPVSRNTNAPPWLYMLEKLGQKAGAFNTVTGGGSTYKKGSGAVVSLQRAVPAYGQIVERVASKFNIPVDFLWGVIGGESGYSKLSRSSVGAGGLVQMMPDAFLTNYAKARKTDPSLPELSKKYEPIGTQVIGKKGRKRNIYEPGIYNEIEDELKNLSAGAAMLRDLAKKYKVTNFSVNQTDPANTSPSPAQIMLIAYNAGGAYGDKLQKELDAWTEKTRNKNYVPPPVNKGALFQPDYTNFFNSSSWSWPSAGSKGLTQHWRYYANRIHVKQIAYLAYAKSQPGGTSQSAPSSPEAPPPPDDFNDRSDERDEETAQSNPQAQASADAATTASDTTGTNAYVPGQVTGSNPSVFNASEAESTLGLLFEKYAKYEYYRSRFETRSATIMLAFNPYIIPGFSAVVLDNDISGFHTVGYVNSVSHSFSASGDMQTTVVLSYVRTLPEYLKLAITGTNDITLNADQDQDTEVGPSEVIDSVEKALQYYTSSNLFFSQLFYSGVSKGSSLVFNIDEFMDLTDLEGNVIAAFNDGGDWTPEKGLLALPRNNFKDYFRSYDAAMNFASRPVATLQQMIELKHGVPLAEAIKAKQVQGPLNPYSSSASSTFYARIYHLDQPGADVDEAAISKVTNVGNNNSELTEGNWEVITADHGIPESRRNWDSILINYRNVVRGSKAAASQ